MYTVTGMHTQTQTHAYTNTDTRTYTQQLSATQPKARHISLQARLQVYYTRTHVIQSLTMMIRIANKAIRSVSYR